MKRLILSGNFSRIVLFIAATIFINHLSAQDVSYYQYRKVEPSKVEEFIKRETTYWAKVVEKGMAKGDIEFWGLFEKVSAGSTDGPNFLFVNTFKDIDVAMKGEMWDATKVFPAIPMAKMETNSISKLISTILTVQGAWEQSPKLTGTDDIKYVVMNYHHVSDGGLFVAAENKVWQPFIKGEMAAGRTKQLAWGNQIILSPSAGKTGPSSLSIDLFPTFKDALMPQFATDTKFPDDGFAEIDKLTTSPRDIEIYRVVKIIARQN